MSVSKKQCCKLLVCDLDNTLVKGPFVSSWQLIWDYLDCDPAIRRHGWDHYHSGAFSYEDWCAHDAKTFRDHGLHRDDFGEICKDLSPAHNLKKTLSVLQERGTQMAIISGALDVIADTALPWHGDYFDRVHVNQSRFCDDGYLETIIPTPYDFEGKLRGVETLCADYGVSACDTVFMGDGMNDLSVSGHVGLTIAFGSECEEVRNAFDLDLPGDDFSRILDYLDD